MTRKEILKKAQLHPKAFCPGCWSQVKKILRLFETKELTEKKDDPKAK